MLLLSPVSGLSEDAGRTAPLREGEHGVFLIRGLLFLPGSGQVLCRFPLPAYISGNRVIGSALRQAILTGHPACRPGRESLYSHAAGFPVPT
jgi:hypothetical protein